MASATSLGNARVASVHFRWENNRLPYARHSTTMLAGEAEFDAQMATALRHGLITEAAYDLLTDGIARGEQTCAEAIASWQAASGFQPMVISSRTVKAVTAGAAASAASSGSAGPSELGSALDEPPLLCTGCNRIRTATLFSATQRKESQELRRCKACVEASGASSGPAETAG